MFSQILDLRRNINEKFNSGLIEYARDKLPHFKESEYVIRNTLIVLTKPKDSYLNACAKAYNQILDLLKSELEQVTKELTDENNSDTDRETTYRYSQVIKNQIEEFQAKTCDPSIYYWTCFLLGEYYRSKRILGINMPVIFLYCDNIHHCANEIDILAEDFDLNNIDILAENLFIGVLLHEYGHAFMDFEAYHTSLLNYFMEESLANLFMLSCLKHSNKFSNIVQFVKLQPFAYKAGLIWETAHLNKDVCIKWGRNKIKSENPSRDALLARRKLFIIAYNHIYYNSTINPDEVHDLFNKAL